MTELCKVEDLKYMNSQYEYRALACAVMDHILLEAELSDGARTLWMILYRRAGLTQEMTCECSVSYLKNRTGKSEATLKRHLNELKRAGYLLNISSQDHPDIYGPRLPMHVMDELQRSATKRVVKRRPLRRETKRDYGNVCNFSGSQSASNKAQQKSTTEVRGNQNLKRSESVSEISDDNVTDEFFDELLRELSETPETQKEVKTAKVTSIQDAKPKTENKVVRVFPQMKEDIKTRLSKMGFDKMRADALTNEIEWTVQAGSMRHWPTKKAINVCLKLIREERWTAPRLMA